VADEGDINSNRGDSVGSAVVIKDVHQLTRMRLMIAATKMVRNCSKVAEMMAEEDGVVDNCNLRLGGTSDDNTI
ncbi:hypothetical protein GW17_00061944, partial [Ensete ventricosum]